MSATVVKCTLNWCLKIYSRKLRVVSIAEWVLDKLMVINNDKKWNYPSLSISFHVCQAGCWTHYLYLLENNSEWVVLLYPSYILENWAWRVCKWGLRAASHRDAGWGRCLWVALPCPRHRKRPPRLFASLGHTSQTPQLHSLSEGVWWWDSIQMCFLLSDKKCWRVFR